MLLLCTLIKHCTLVYADAILMNDELRHFIKLCFFAFLFFYETCTLLCTLLALCSTAQAVQDGAQRTRAHKKIKHTARANFQRP